MKPLIHIYATLVTQRRLFTAPSPTDGICIAKVNRNPTFPAFSATESIAEGRKDEAQEGTTYSLQETLIHIAKLFLSIEIVMIYQL